MHPNHDSAFRCGDIVSAVDLDSDITVTSSNSKVTVAKASGWNATTGGTLVITADAATAGSYNATVTVASGSVSKQIAVAVAIEGGKSGASVASVAEEIYKYYFNSEKDDTTNENTQTDTLIG